MKISAYHKARGDRVEWHFPLSCYDVTYMSKVFTFTPDYPNVISSEEVVLGGTGYDLENKLPAEIENQCPDYSLYPQYSDSYGFLTRGCPNNCPFCIVTKKEGAVSRQVADLSCFHQGQKVIKLLDPNLLAFYNHEALLQQLADSGAYVDFTQGLDIRLTSSDNIALLNKIKVKMLHFAWDNPRQDLIKRFQKYNELTTIKDFRKKRVYVLTNFNSTHEEDLYRVDTLRRIGFDPFVMIYEKETAPKITKQLARWCNNKFIFRTCECFENYDPKKG